MSKRKNQTNNNFIDLRCLTKGNTIVERWENLEKTEANVIAFLHIESARLLSMEEPAPNIINECADFYEEFGDYLAEYIEMVDIVENEWFGQLPRVLAIGMENSFDGVIAEDVEAMVDYIWNIRASRYVTVTINSKAKQLVISKTLKKEDLKDCRDALAVLIYGAMYDLGSIIFRYYNEATGKYIINGFLCHEDGVEKIRPEELKFACELQPDGSMVAADDEEYSMAFVNFSRNHVNTR